MTAVKITTGVQAFLKENLRCPDCKIGHLVSNENNLVCIECGSIFPTLAQVPVLMSRDNEIFPRESYIQVPEKSLGLGIRILRKLLPSPSLNLARSRQLDSMFTSLQNLGTSSVLVVGAGRQKESLEKILRGYPNTQLVCVDVDQNADVEAYCDAHRLPFQSGCFQGVIITAVLECVLEPGKVVDEIHRVLSHGGFVYSEFPFLQHVHDGAYDFSRLTLSGHKKLFREFETADAGLVAGPATAFVWSLECLTQSMAPGPRSKLVVKIVVRLTFFWLKYLDIVLKSRPQAIDGASCTFLLGKKSESGKVPDRSLINGYSGAKIVRHIG